MQNEKQPACAAWAVYLLFRHDLLKVNFPISDSRFLLVSQQSVKEVENPDNPTVEELYKLGLPKLVFNKVLSPSTNHTSGHDAINNEIRSSFTPLSIYSETSVLPTFNKGSLSLNTNSVQMGNVGFNSEGDVKRLVQNNIEDIIKLLGMERQMLVLAECSVTNEKGSAHATHRADYWVIWINGRPVIVIEVKSPSPSEVTSILNNAIFTCSICAHFTAPSMYSAL